MPPDPIRLCRDEDLPIRAGCAAPGRSRRREGRDLRAARPQRRRQDDAHQHHLRHGLDERGARSRRRPRHRGANTAPRVRDDRPRAAGDRARHLRDRGRHGALQPRLVRQAARTRPCRAGAARPLALGQARCARDRALGRHEAARDDRQGAEPRARHPLPRRADRGRRCRPAPRHVGARAPAARARRHHHPHHALHRGGGGDGGPRRRDRSRPARAGRGDGGADAEARQAPPRDRVAARDRGHPARPRGMAPAARGGGREAGLRIRRQRAGYGHPAPAPRPRCGRRSTTTISRRAAARSRTSSSAWWGTRHEQAQPRRHVGDLPHRDGAHPPHGVAERGDAGDHHRALFHRVRRRDRLAHPAGGRRRLRRVHRARASSC